MRISNSHSGASPNRFDPPLAVYAVFMTDQKRAPDMDRVIKNLPRGAVVILRDYDAENRQALAKRWRQKTRRKGLKLLIAGDARLARRVRADGIHLPGWQLHRRAVRNPMVPILSAACHSRRDLAIANARTIGMKLVSPVFPTRSHPGAMTLGPHRLARLVDGIEGCIALGGVKAATVRRLPFKRLSGFAAIDGWL